MTAYKEGKILHWGISEPNMDTLRRVNAVFPVAAIESEYNMGLLMDSRPEVIRSAGDGSLRRLGVDHIDLYYQHRIDQSVELEEVASVMAELIQAGRIRTWRISETTEDYPRRANAVCPVTAVQNRYSILTREHEKLFPVLEELNVAYVAFSPLGNGF